MFKNMKIGMGLYFLLGFLSLLLIAIGMFGLRGIKSANASLDSVYNDRLVPAVLLTKIEILRRESVMELQLSLQHDPRIPASRIHEADHPITKHTDAVMANRAKTDKLWEQYMATYLTTEEKRLAESVKVSRKRLREDGQGPMMAFLKERKFDEAGLHSVNRLTPIFREAEQDFDALMQLQADVAKNENDKANAAYIRTRNLASTSIIGGILLALGIGYWIIRSITGRVTESVSVMSSTATEIASAVTQHERTASQQAAMVNETTATVDELGASSRQSSEQAASAAALAQKAATMTDEGDKAVGQAIEAMNSLKGKIAVVAEQILRLGEQMSQIGGIAALVSDIAGQTRMLALNAAVEAARAGEQGKGFAVVASEVRKLADQSKKSAEQANALIAEIQKATNSTIMKTEEGTKAVEDITRLARNVGELFGNLSQAANSVYENARQVLLNTKQQTAAISQVTQAMNTINTGAKETSAGISQTKVGIEKLNETAKGLKEMV